MKYVIKSLRRQTTTMKKYLTICVITLYITLFKTCLKYIFNTKKGLILLFKLIERRLDIAFLVDGCHHVTNLDYKKVLELVQTVYHSSPQTPDHTRVAVVVFSNGFRTLQNFRPTIESSSIDGEIIMYSRCFQ